MIDPDISGRDARRLLSVPDDHPSGIDRRRFLQLMGWGVGAGAMMGGLGELVLPEMVPSRLREAFASTPVGDSEGIVVLVGMVGGMDGLNVVVPYTNSLYYQQHGAIAVPANKVLALNSAVGLHPNLPFVKGLFDRGEVAVVQGVGYPNPDLSHFSSMANWMYGKAGNGYPSTGWVGRWLDGLSGDDLFRAATVGSGLPLHLIGENKRGTAIPEWGVGFAGGTDVHDQWMYNAMSAFSSSSAGRGPWHDTIAGTVKGVIDVGRQVSPVFARDLPDADLEKKMTVVARLINADLGLRVIDTSYDGFDNHSGEPVDLGDRMTDFDNAMRAFFTTLDDRFRSRVVIVTYSEFGRTSYSNDSSGTDHGTANNHFVIGRGVKGGLVGAQPSLAGLDRWDRMAFNVDFRSMYATVLDNWLGGGSTTVLGATYPNLGLFKQGPGVGVATGSVPASSLGDFVGLTPARLCDTRNSGRLMPLGAGTTGEVQVLGVGGVPASGVTAVALNVTAANATSKSSFTVWSAGDVKPDIENVIMPPSRPVPGLVIVKPGKGGRVSIQNDQGATQCIVDVVGYFSVATANRLHPLTPFRALDTRNGIGGRKVPAPPGGSFDVVVRGVGGVPTNADSVVVNITAVSPTAQGYLTVWPSGQTRPNASCVNFVAGLTVPNLVIAKVGTNNKISIFNAFGNTQVIVDILGYMAAGTTGRHYPVPAARVFDTTPDNVAPLAVNSNTTITVLGKGGVPATGVSAVALNLSARNPTGNTFLTVWPNGEARPNASNLNPHTGSDVSNLVIVKVGTAGAVQVYNSVGTVDLLVDVVGYFTG